MENIFEKLRDEELDMAAGGKIENISRIYVS